MAPCVKVIVIGAGSRGQNYSNFALDFPERMKVVGVADPQPFVRRSLQEKHSIEDCNVFDDWTAVTKREKFADAAIICTPDKLHKDPAIAFAKKGYHILLEKPMAVTEEDCKEIVSVCKDNEVMLSVCHVLRYFPAVLKIKELLKSGVIGDVVHIQHLEPVGFWHFAHAYVRGSWRNEEESTFSLLAKSCHDIDLINYWMDGKRCLKVSSFGTLQHFTKENKPTGAADRCLDCSVEPTCPFSAKKIYLQRLKQGNTGWPVSVVCRDTTTDIESLTEALCYGPYGRCVYNCDNDVVTNQVVNMEFEGGATAAFSMIAFTERLCERKTTIYGTKGELNCEGSGPVYVFDFLSGQKVIHPSDTSNLKQTRLLGHGGADYYLMDSFISAVAENNKSLICTGPDETLASHLLVFDAEKSRKENRVVFCRREDTVKM